MPTIFFSLREVSPIEIAKRTCAEIREDDVLGVPRS